MKPFTDFVIAFVHILIVTECLAFWDEGTSTIPYAEPIKTPRLSFFSWEQVTIQYPSWTYWWTLPPDWTSMEGRKLSTQVAGFSFGFLPLSTGTLLNTRVVLTAANFLEPYVNRMREVRIWALGRSGDPIHPWRYRVWRWRRVFPRSINPEHQHGPRGRHTPRHDIAVVHSWDQIYIVYSFSWLNYMYPLKAKLAAPYHVIKGCKWLIHVGYKVGGDTTITHTILNWLNIVNCERYLPKWWGKFICVKNIPYKPDAVMNGDALFADWVLVGLGCFEIRYNDDRVLVFTDVRYYNRTIYTYANITSGEYYEYAYPHWGVDSGWIGLYDSLSNSPNIPKFQNKHKYFFPLGK